MKTDKETLKKLEADVTKYHNKQVTLLSEYATACKEGDKVLQDEIDKTYKDLHFKIKELNRRITLLKNQSWEL